MVSIKELQTQIVLRISWQTSFSVHSVGLLLQDRCVMFRLLKHKRKVQLLWLWLCSISIFFVSLFNLNYNNKSKIQFFNDSHFVGACSYDYQLSYLATECYVMCHSLLCWILFVSFTRDTSVDKKGIFAAQNSILCILSVVVWKFPGLRSGPWSFRQCVLTMCHVSRWEGGGQVSPYTLQCNSHPW